MEDAVEDSDAHQRSANPTNLGRNYWARSQIAMFPKLKHNNGERSITIEVLEGYAVDLDCLRKCPQAKLAERARAHTQDCVLMGHCVASGFGLVDDDGRVAVLDAEATLGVVGAVRRSRRRQGIRLRVIREMKEGEMVTSAVEEATTAGA